MSRVSYQVKKQLFFHEKIRVRTWVASAKLIHSDRDYLIYDEKGEVAVLGTSRWCIVDRNTRALRKIATLFPMSVIGAEKYFDSNKVDEISAPPTSATRYTVRASDIDINQHMNNAKYADLVFNSFSPEEHHVQFIRELHVNYLSEMYCGNDITVNRWDNTDGITIEGAGDKPAFRAHVKTVRV